MSTIDSILLFAILGAILSVGLARTRLREVDTFSSPGRSISWPRVGLSLIGADAVFVAALLVPEWAPARPLMMEGALLGIVILLLVPAWLAGRVMSAASHDQNSTTSGVHASTAVSIGTLIVIGLRMAFAISAGALLLPAVIGQESAGLLALAILVAGIPALAGGFVPVVRMQLFCALALCVGVYTMVIAGLPAANAGVTPAEVFGAMGVVNGAFPFFGAIVAVPVLVLWYWGADPTMAQHLLAGRSAAQTARGMRCAGALKVYLVAMVILLWAVVPADGFPRLLSSGPGYRGGAAALVLATVIASLAGLFTSASSILTPMFVGRKTPTAGERVDHLAARLATTGVIGIALLGIPLVRIGLQMSGSFLPVTLLLAASPIAAVAVFDLAGRPLAGRSLRASLAVSGICSAAWITMRFAGEEGGEGVPAGLGAMHPLDAAALVMVIAAAVAGAVELSRTSDVGKRRIVETPSRT